MVELLPLHPPRPFPARDANARAAVRDVSGTGAPGPGGRGRPIEGQVFLALRWRRAGPTHDALEAR